MEKKIEAVITGRVQMVMYRDFSQKKARSLSITGTVQNLSDGSVRVVAQGNEGDLEKYVDLLKKGPIFSRVDNVTIVELSKLNEYKEFNIIF